jgi:hypothetical protein
MSRENNIVVLPSSVTRRTILATTGAAIVSGPAIASSAPGGIKAPSLEAAFSGLAASGAGLCGADPIFEVIAGHRAAIKAYSAACNNLPDDETGSDAALDHEGKVLLAVLTMQPTTMAGVAALLEHVALPEFLRDEPDAETILSAASQSTEHDAAAAEFPRRLAATVLNLMRARAAKARLVEPDPVYAAIERHRAAWAEWGAKCCALDDEGTPEARAEWHRLYDAASDARDELLRLPETIAGVVAVIRYVAARMPGATDAAVIVTEDKLPWFVHAIGDALEKITS